MSDPASNNETSSKRLRGIMQTEVIMKRELLGGVVSQKSKSEFFSATDLVKIANKLRAKNDRPTFNFSSWLKNEGTVEFMGELEKRYGEIMIKGGKKGTHTWVHPLLFIDLALALDPKLKLDVYEWLFDHLIRYRNESGDSYKKMCGALYAGHKNKSTFAKNIKKLASLIQERCGVKDWQHASEEQLALRDRIHEEIALLSEVLRDNNQAIRAVLARLDKPPLKQAKN